jgi:hypothetical protein
MSFFRFVFSFLYVRNWDSGQMEISRPRLYVFLSFILLLMVATIMIALLQIPITFTAI